MFLQINSKYIFFRFLYASPKWGENTTILEEKLSDFATNTQPVIEPDSAIAHIADMPSTSEKDQFILLSSICNYHWMPLPSINDSTKLTTGKHITYAQHVYFDISPAQETKTNYVRRHLPASARNRLMHLSTCEETEYSLYATIRHLFMKDTQPENIQHETDIPEIPPPAKKRMKHTRRLVTVTQKAVYECVGEGLSTSLNCANPNRGIYRDFKEQLIHEGVIYWRSHSEDMDICVMNDYQPTSGVLLPNSFVHVTCFMDDPEGPIVKCTCAIFALLQRCAHQGIELRPNEEVLPDEKMPCMHTRFYREYLIGGYDSMSASGVLSKPLEKISKTLQFIEDPVHLLGSVFPKATTKFSVAGSDCYSTINISFPNGKCYAKCLNGMCAANLRNKKKIPKSLSLKEKDKLCSHIRTLSDHLEYVQAFFPDYFGDDAVPNAQENLAPPPPQQDIANNDDINIRPDQEVHFDYNTGLWSFPALSKHKPVGENSMDLLNSTKLRNDVTVSHNMNDDSGVYQDYSLTPGFIENNGNFKMCACGAGYNENCVPKLQFEANMFTRMGVVLCKCYNVECSSGNCELSYEEAAAEQNVFFYTKATCAGDEIGWDFNSLTHKGKFSFTAFCKESTRRYKTNNVSSRSFMSPNTFISWYFAWLSAQKIDFRKHVDPWCKYNPKILACDGTHIGVSLKNLRLEDPVTKPDVEDIKRPRHKRNDRVIISDHTQRRHLRYLCKKMLDKLKPGEEIDEEIEGERTMILIEHIRNKCPPNICEFLLVFLQKTQDEEVIKIMAKLLYMFSGDAGVSSVMPFGAHNIVSDCCTDAQSDRRNIQGLDGLKHWCKEIADLLLLGRRFDCLDMISNFCTSIIDLVKAIHEEDDPAPPVVRQPGTYNPRSGTAYYFTEHGEKIRQLPIYEVGGKTRSKTHDDAPHVDPPCRKFFPEVSFGGFGYIFLWFCPIHGHSYGFHMIAGGEGRKDPFASLYKYCETMPEHVFFDFACQLHEYCMNREPDLFRNTRFWHDLFHQIGHLCGYNFRSGRVLGLTGINSEICEQWNSFLQCVKYTASHLTQDHFVCFLQYHLHLINEEKTKTFKLTATIAIAGTL